MGASLSTIGGWSIIFSIAGWYAYKYWAEGHKREALRIAAQRQRIEDRQNLQARKETKAKKQRGDAYSKDLEDPDKATKPKQRPAKTTSTSQVVAAQDYSTDDGIDNREFARQLAGVKQGTSFTAPKKTEEKRQRSVKQSRAREISGNVDDGKISAPSSTAGADADDDQSPAGSPQFQAVEAADISDMLERPTPGPSILRITNTDKLEAKVKRTKTPEAVETKKQRQNKRKAEEAKAAREEAEKERKVKMEAQRRLARVSEGRAAKDGSQFVASQAPARSAWVGNGTNGSTHQGESDGDFLPVQPLDTYEPPKTVENSHPVGQAHLEQTESWMSSLPSEEEQMEMLRDEQAWSTVKQKKPGKAKKDTARSSEEPEGNLVTKPQQVVPVASEPVGAKSQTARPNGRPTPSIAQSSSFAALSSKNEGPEEDEEEEWDV